MPNHSIELTTAKAFSRMQQVLIFNHSSNTYFYSFDIERRVVHQMWCMNVHRYHKPGLLLAHISISPGKCRWNRHSVQNVSTINLISAKKETKRNEFITAAYFQSLSNVLHRLNGREHSRWCSERYVRKSLPHAKNLVRSVIDADFNDSWIFVTFSQLRCIGLPHAPPIFCRTCAKLPAKQIATNGFSYVWLLLVQIGFFSNIRRGDEHAFTCAFRPNARYVSCNVQPPSWSTRISIWE